MKVHNFAGFFGSCEMELAAEVIYKSGLSVVEDSLFKTADTYTRHGFLDLIEYGWLKPEKTNQKRGTGSYRVSKAFFKRVEDKLAEKAKKS